MQFGTSTTDWFPVESLGSFFKLDEGTLLSAPMLKDGSMEMYEGCHGEVEFGSIDDEEECKLVGEALAALGTSKFEGEAGDVLPEACDVCHIRVGDTCEHYRKVQHICTNEW